MNTITIAKVLVVVAAAAADPGAGDAVMPRFLAIEPLEESDISYDMAVLLAAQLHAGT